MLVLARKKGERIVIGGGDSGYPEVVIHLVDLNHRRAHVGVDAPKDVPIVRGELLDGKESESAPKAETVKA